MANLPPAYDPAVDALIYKNEGRTGPSWVRRKGEKTPFCAVWGDPPTWLTPKQAKAVADRLGLPMFEV